MAMFSRIGFKRIALGLVILTGITMFLLINKPIYVVDKHFPNWLLDSRIGLNPLLHSSVNIINTEELDKSRTVPTIYCVKGKLSNYSFPFCTYPPEDDFIVSGMVLKGEYFEPMHVLNIMKCMMTNSFQFVDLGANLGTYTLPMAHIKQKVLAVEANFDNVARLKKAIYLGDVSQYVTLLHNAVSDGHKTLSLGMTLNNRGDTYLLNSINCTQADRKKCVPSTVETITLNDLIPLIDSRPVIFKVDVQGEEIKTFTTPAAGRFFDVARVPYIFLEWVLYKDYWNKGVSERNKVDEWLNFFLRQKLHRSSREHWCRAGEEVE